MARTRTLDAPVEAVWRVLEDPYALPRWWPLVRRVEGVSEAGWTMIMSPPEPREGGRGVRADQRLEASEPPALRRGDLPADERRDASAPPAMRRWALEAAGSPFERVLRASAVEARLAPSGDGRSALTLELRQSPRGLARFGGFMLRRAGRRTLDAALDGMARAVER